MNSWLISICCIAFQDMVYWSDWDTESIFKANKFNGNNVSSVAVDLFSPMDLHIHHPYRQPNAVNRCNSTSSGQCSHLCLPAPFNDNGSPKYTCACPGDRKLMDDGHTCEPEGESCGYWLVPGWGLRSMAFARYFVPVQYHVIFDRCQRSIAAVAPVKYVSKLFIYSVWHI